MFTLTHNGKRPRTLNLFSRAPMNYWFELISSNGQCCIGISDYALISIVILILLGWPSFMVLWCFTMLLTNIPSLKVFTLFVVVCQKSWQWKVKHINHNLMCRSHNTTNYANNTQGINYLSIAMLRSHQHEVQLFRNKNKDFFAT